MFIHFNVATFNERQWATGHEDPASFAPTKLDCGQWADAAKSAAGSANACCQDTQTKIDRMFKKSMYK